MPTGRLRIAVLGAGIMGCSLALLLARRGVDVTLFDAQDAPFCGASRWNEGKIHLGHMYAADPSMATAAKVLPGALRFRPLLEDLLDGSIASAITGTDDLYLCHRRSVAPPDAMAAYLHDANRLVRQHPDARRYLVDVSGAACHRLSASELAALTDSPDIVAGFRVPERSVRTDWIADRFVAAVAAQSRINQRMGVRVLGVSSHGRHGNDRLTVVTSAGSCGPFDRVVNALWEGRLAVDRTAGILPPATWTHRYRQAVFVQTRQPLDLPCSMIATGPFGDMKNYDGTSFYLSWYPVGLRIESQALAPPPAPVSEDGDDTRVIEQTLSRLQACMPWIATLRPQIAHARVRGGWVYAVGSGGLGTPDSTLHRRADYGLTRAGNYLSVDTGKYSSAPWMAAEIVDELL